MREKRRNDSEFKVIDGAKTAEYLRRKRESNPAFRERDNARRTNEYRTNRDQSAAELLSMLRNGELVPVGNPCFAYLFYDDAGLLLYVGITNDPNRRLYQHARDKTWFETIATINLAAFRSETEAMAVEAMLIISLCPLHNIRHKGLSSLREDSLDDILSRFASVDLAPTTARKLVIA